MSRNKEPQRIAMALLSSPEWRSWENQAYKLGWDWAETSETGWMSDGHFTAFMEFVRTTKRKLTVKEVVEVEVESL